MKERNEEEYEYGITSFRTIEDLKMKKHIESLLNSGVISKEEIKTAIEDNSVLELWNNIERKIIGV